MKIHDDVDDDDDDDSYCAETICAVVMITMVIVPISCRSSWLPSAAAKARKRRICCRHDHWGSWKAQFTTVTTVVKNGAEPLSYAVQQSERQSALNAT